jgi:prolyl-tRNA editing enzyme YbaK/EbsC (Cys-tRNA(Pro) deacylase)
MTVETVRAFLADKAPDIAIIDLPTCTATVALAAEAHGVAPGQIAKSLLLEAGGRRVLIVTRGDTRIDNQKFKQTFGRRAKMLGPEDVEAVTGHPIGGVCPFGLASRIPIFCDISLKAFSEVLPAAGSISSAVRIAPERLSQLVDAKWVDVCRELDQFHMPNPDSQR